MARNPEPPQQANPHHDPPNDRGETSGSEVAEDEEDGSSEEESESEAEEELPDTRQGVAPHQMASTDSRSVTAERLTTTALAVYRRERSQPGTSAGRQLSFFDIRSAFCGGSPQAVDRCDASTRTDARAVSHLPERVAVLAPSLHDKAREALREHHSRKRAMDDAAGPDVFAAQPTRGPRPMYP